MTKTAAESTSLHNDAAAPSSEAVEPEIRALFDPAGGAVFDQRNRLLNDAGPEEWEGLAFPVEFALELAAVCNLACVMCPVPTTSRPKKLMAPEIFRRVIDEVSNERGFVLLPQGFGESMLHKQWADLVGYAVEHGIHPVVMLTNGMLLNDANIERLLALEIDALLVSIDGVDRETYAKVRVGGDLDRVEANVRRFLELRGSRPLPHLVLRIIRMRETSAEIDQFFARWKPLLAAGDALQINEYNDWAGKVEDHSIDGLDSSQSSRGPCRMLWRNLSVHADGKVSACCLDSEDELIVGDLSRGDTIRNIWHGEALARLRRIHREGRFAELPICQRCKNWY